MCILGRNQHHLAFLRRYFDNPHVVGAIAPSSSALGKALCAPYARSTRPARVLEVGAGTGAVTRVLSTLLRPTDTLDICEVEPAFADILQRDVLTLPGLAAGVADGRVCLLRKPVQEITAEDHYDFVISGLPLTAFAIRDVLAVMRVIRRCLKRSGVLSYFEYVALRKATRALALGRRRAHVRMVSAYLSRTIKTYEVDRTTVLRNFPPAHARHLQFTR